MRRSLSQRCHGSSSSFCTAIVIASFRNQGTEDLLDGRDAKQAPGEKLAVRPRAHGQEKLDQLNQAAVLGDLRAPPSNRLEKLKGERSTALDIRIDDRVAGVLPVGRLPAPKTLRSSTITEGRLSEMAQVDSV